MSSKPLAYRQHGLTLIELIIFIVVVSVGLAGILLTFNVTSRSSADPLVTKQMLAIAESLMEEVKAKDFDGNAASRDSNVCFAGPYAQGQRENFDCVVNYNGFPFSTAKGIYQIDGVSTVPGLDAYRAEVTVVAGNMANVSANNSALATNPDASNNVWLITVTVRNGSDALTLTGYRLNYDRAS